MKTNLFYLLVATALTFTSFARNGFSAETTESTKPCFHCNGAGSAACKAAGCVDGKKNCPAPCMKATVGRWEKMKVDGHGPDELWQKYYYPKEPQRYVAWTQAHTGEVVQIKDGVPTNIGKCKACGGATKVTCDKCKGSKIATCWLCDGKKLVPSSWQPNDNPKINNDPKAIRLKDGRVLRGTVIRSTGTKTTIRTEDGKLEEVASDQIIRKARP